MSSLRPVLISMTLLLLSQTAHAWTPAEFTYETWPNGAAAGPTTLQYRLRPPPSVTSGTRYPLVVFLHGAGERGGDTERDLQMRNNGQFAFVSTENEMRNPCYMAIPQATWAGWGNSDRRQLVLQMINDLLLRFPIDPDRIIITGISMGGNGTIELIGDAPGMFSAAVPMSGWGAGTMSRLDGLPIWYFHAADDGTVEITGGDNFVNGLRNNLQSVIYTRYDTGGHAIWRRAYETAGLMDWIFAQRRGVPATGIPIVTITNPSMAPRIPAPGAITLSGTANVGSAAISGVQWAIPSGASGAATGTTSWSADVTGTGNRRVNIIVSTSGYLSGAPGVTTINDGVALVASGSDLTAPVVRFVTPVTMGTFTTAMGATTVDISGTATDDRAVTELSWSTSRGGYGVATLATGTWTATAVPVWPGENRIRAMGRDAANNRTSAEITVVVPGGPITMMDAGVDASVRDAAVVDSGTDSSVRDVATDSAVRPDASTSDIVVNDATVRDASGTDVVLAVDVANQDTVALTDAQQNTEGGTDAARVDGNSNDAADGGTNEMPRGGCQCATAPGATPVGVPSGMAALFLFGVARRRRRA